ncbi:MAG: hypothetical protein ACLQAH_01460 [Limisphaerales bacterium]
MERIAEKVSLLQDTLELKPSILMVVYPYHISWCEQGAFQLPQSRISSAGYDAGTYKYYIVPVDGADNPRTSPSNIVNFAAG